MFIIVAILLFFADILSFILFKGWILYSLPTLFLFTNLKISKNIFYLNCFFILLILIQDYFIFGRVGLSFIYLLPILIFTPVLRKLFDFRGFIFNILLLLFLLIFNLFFIKNLVFSLNIALYSTLLCFFINIIVGFLIFLGISGNRS